MEGWTRVLCSNRWTKRKMLLTRISEVMTWKLKNVVEPGPFSLVSSCIQVSEAQLNGRLQALDDHGLQQPAQEKTEKGNRVVAGQDNAGSEQPLVKTGDNGKKVSTAHVVTVCEQQFLKNKVMGKYVVQGLTSKGKESRPKRKKKITGAAQFCSGFQRGAIFRAAASAISSSMSVSSGAYRQILSRNEAQETVKLGKALGIEIGGNDESVIQKIMVMEKQDEDRVPKKGIIGGA
ncbi:hypothetical protein LOK49_LG09G02053 [Camellia lanceoleosa]|uniref:Uncharacterized protein n=1 Tax=Camellia lanceoleosa TaxID=1840588 RepID=A0ACC0GKB6_9ERIC|nr:hypothetical protein LOK49_LG09G02053 [Camellia lanceoleosa]